MSRKSDRREKKHILTRWGPEEGINKQKRGRAKEMRVVVRKGKSGWGLSERMTGPAAPKLERWRWGTTGEREEEESREEAAISEWKEKREGRKRGKEAEDMQTKG